MLQPSNPRPSHRPLRWLALASTVLLAALPATGQSSRWMRQLGTSGTDRTFPAGSEAPGQARPDCHSNGTLDGDTGGDGLLLSSAPASAQNDASSRLHSTNLSPTMVGIPSGSFLLGSDAPGALPYNNGSYQQPVHQVTISQPFWMSRHEITQGHYQALMGTNPSYFVAPDRPVEQVSWYDAMAYCAALNAQQSAAGQVPSGYQYRLPTEAEWEYACRAGTTTEFHYGPGLYCAQAMFWQSYHSGTYCSSFGTVPVGSYAPNAWGLYDMHGNVWEWCLDGWSLYTAGAKTDPYVAGGPSRVFRGGGWGSDSSYCRSAYRGKHYPAYTGFNYGFRVVLAPVLVP